MQREIGEFCSRVWWRRIWKSLKNKSKDTLIEESQKDAENYEDKADDSIKANDEEVKMAELLLVNDVAPQNQASEVSHQWSAFKLQIWPPNIWTKEWAT